MDTSFEKIVPWNGAQDTGRDVRLKWERNFSRVASALTELAGDDKKLSEAIDSILKELNNFLRKDKEDKTLHLLRLLGGIITNSIVSEDFTTGALGSGFCLKKDENGDSYLEVDRALFRKTVTFIELLIQSMRHVGGQIMLTPASMHCVKVEEYDTFYRCFFESTDGDKTIAQEFVVDDQARCQTFNIKEGVNENVSNQYYWRLVVGIGDDYIDLSKEDCDAGSTVPKAGDDIVQLGNRTDATRQSAIVLSSYGNDAPYFKLYRGIDSYSLSGKEFVSFSRSEVMIIADSIRMSTGETVKEYIDGVIANIDFGGGENLLINSKLDNTEGWTMDTSIEEYEGYTCLKLSSNRGFSTTAQENARLVPWGATVTNSVDVYATAECDIKLGFASKPNDIHITELNKWVRVSITQELDEGNPSFFYIMGGSGSSAANVHVKNAKCEKGTEATDWKPSIFDIDLVEQKVQSQLTMTKNEIRLEVEQQITNVKSEVSEEVDAKLSVAAGEIKSEVSSTINSLGSAGDNIVQNGNIQESPGYGNPGFIELYKSLVPGDTYTAVLSGELPDGHRFQLCDSGQWEIQGEFELAQGHRIYVLRFTYEPNSQTLEHDKLYLRVEPEDGDPWDLFWICLYEGDVIPPYSFVPAPQEQESGSLDIGVRNLILNSKLDNRDGWSLNYSGSVVSFGGYNCLKIDGAYHGWYTSPDRNSGNVPLEGVITNSIDVYATEECDIHFGLESLPNTVHITELNKWVRVHNTQELDGKTHAYYVYGGEKTIYCKDVKCETGTVATGWTPAPEDLKGFEGQNLVVRGRYGITDSTSYWIRDVYLSKDLTEGKTYTAVLSGDVGSSQQFGLWDSAAVGYQGMFTKKSGRIYTLTFAYTKSSSASDNSLLTLHNYPQSGVAANPAGVDWLCIYEGAVDAPDVFVPAPEDDAELVAWGGHYNADKNDIYLNGVQAETETGRALHLHKLDLTRMKITMVGKYDVYATTGDAKTQFVTALNGITGDNLAIVTSRDAITIDTNMQAALRDFGADAPLMTQARMSFVLVGKKGIGAGNGVMKTSAVSAASVTVRIIEGVCMDFFGNGNFVTWKEETKTWIKETDQKINLHAESITTIGDRVSRAESDISMNAKEIELRVKDEDLDGNEVVSRINQTATTITIDASKINLVGKVTIGMLDKTILENGKIKTELINADAIIAKNIQATKGTISGFEISSNHIGMAEDKDGVAPGGFSLYSYRLSIGEPNCMAWIGSRVMYAGSNFGSVAGRFEVNSSNLYENIGIYISVQGSKPYDDTINTGNAALHIAKGAIYGTRFRLRNLDASATITVMDTFIVAVTAGIRITLPSSPEDGQFFFVTNRSTGDITVYCASKLFTGNTTAKSSSATVQRGKAAFVYYDSTNSVYQCHWLGNWEQ